MLMTGQTTNTKSQNLIIHQVTAKSSTGKQTHAPHSKQSFGTSPSMLVLVCNLTEHMSPISSQLESRIQDYQQPNSFSGSVFASLGWSGGPPEFISSRKDVRGRVPASIVFSSSMFKTNKNIINIKKIMNFTKKWHNTEILKIFSFTGNSWLNKYIYTFLDIVLCPFPMSKKQLCS